MISIGTLARMRLKILGGGVALLALAAALMMGAQPAEAQAGVSTGTLVEGETVVCILEQGGGTYHTCKVTVPGTGTIAVSASDPAGKSGIVASTPTESNREISFVRSTVVESGNDAKIGIATWTITNTPASGSAVTYKVEVRTYPSGDRPQGVPTGLWPPRGDGKVFNIDFVGDSDGVVPAGKNVVLKVTRTGATLEDRAMRFRVKSVSISGLSLRVVEWLYYEDNTYTRNNEMDPDTDPDVRVFVKDIGQVYDETFTVIDEQNAITGFPSFSGDLIENIAAMRNQCWVRTDGYALCDDPGTKSRGDVGTDVVALEIVIPPSATPGTYTVTVTGYKSLKDRTVVTETRTLTVGSAPSVTTVSFGPSAPRRAVTGDTDTTPADGYADDASLAESTTIATGETTELTLSLQSALNKPPEAGTVSSIFVTTTNGTLSTESIGKVTKRAQTANCKTQNASSCEIDLKPLKDSGGALPAKIRVQLKAPTTPGKATVSATVIAGGKVHQPEPVTVTFTGPPKSLSLGEAPSTVLGYDVGKDQASDYDAAKAPDRGADARDQITFMVKATDGAAGAGNEVKTPTLTVAVHDGSGSLVSKGKYQTTQSGTLMNMLLLDIDASASAPLKPGEYKLTVTSGALKAEGMFRVAGDAAMMELALEPMSADTFGQEVTATATVTDAEGNAVADGTPVTFRVSDFRGDSDSVAVLDTTGAMLSKDGEAMATLTVVGAGNAVVRATTSKAGGGTLLKTAVLVSRAGAPAAADDDDPLDCLSELSGFSVWTCTGETTASEIFTVVSGRGASAVHLWNGSAWIRYSVVNGAMVPGSRDFPVGRNDVIYISN